MVAYDAAEIDEETTEHVAILGQDGILTIDGDKHRLVFP